MRTKEYRFPIDILWVDESHDVVHLLNMPNLMRKILAHFYGPPPEPARYVLQTGSGFIKKSGVSKGDELKYVLRM